MSKNLWLRFDKDGNLLETHPDSEATRESMRRAGYHPVYLPDWAPVWAIEEATGPPKTDVRYSLYEYVRSWQGLKAALKQNPRYAQIAAIAAGNTDLRLDLLFFASELDGLRDNPSAANLASMHSVWGLLRARLQGLIDAGTLPPDETGKTVIDEVVEVAQGLDIVLPEAQDEPN